MNFTIHIEIDETTCEAEIEPGNYLIARSDTDLLFKAIAAFVERKLEENNIPI